MMKATILVVSMLGLAAAVEDLQACMYCKRADTNAGYMASFSYCPDSEDQRCLKNFWEYIQ